MSNQIMQKPIREPDWVGPARVLASIVERRGELDREASAKGGYGHNAADHSTRTHVALCCPKAHFPPSAATLRRKFRFLRLVLQAATLFDNAFASRRLLEQIRQGVEHGPQRQARSMLSEHTLRDIGLMRIDVEAVAQGPFWRSCASRKQVARSMI